MTIKQNTYEKGHEYVHRSQPLKNKEEQILKVSQEKLSMKKDNKSING